MATLPPSHNSGRPDEAMLQPDTSQRSDASRLLRLKETAYNLPMAIFWLLAGIVVSLCWIALFLAIGYAIGEVHTHLTKPNSPNSHLTPRKPQHELDANYYYEPRCLRLVAIGSGRTTC